MALALLARDAIVADGEMDVADAILARGRSVGLGAVDADDRLDADRSREWKAASSCGWAPEKTLSVTRWAFSRLGSGNRGERRGAGRGRRTGRRMHAGLFLPLCTREQTDAEQRQSEDGDGAKHAAAADTCSIASRCTNAEATRRICNSRPWPRVPAMIHENLPALDRRPLGPDHRDPGLSLTCPPSKPAEKNSKRRWASRASGTTRRRPSPSSRR